jgi:hypothetical protein
MMIDKTQDIQVFREYVSTNRTRMNRAIQMVQSSEIFDLTSKKGTKSKKTNGGLDCQKARRKIYGILSLATNIVIGVKKLKAQPNTRS